MEEISRIKRSAHAAAYLFFFLLLLFLNQSGAFGRFVGHVHKAFWCAVIELAVLTPIRTITYLSDLRPEPRIFQRLQDFVLNTLLAEAICSSTARWVQLFVAHGSLSPFSPGTPTTLSLCALEVVGASSQGLAFLYIIQIVYDINAVLRTSQDEVESKAEVAWANHEPLDNDDAPDFVYALIYRLIYVYFAGQALLYGFVAHMFTTMAMYLQRMAVGTAVTAVTAHVNAYNTLPSWLFWIFGIWMILTLGTIIGRVIELDIEALAEEEVRRHRPMGGPLEVDDEDLDEAAERRLGEFLEAVIQIGHVEVLLNLINFEPLPEVAVPLADLLEEPPPLRARRQRRETIEHELLNRIQLYVNWVMVECINLLVPRWFALPAPWRHISLRWLCPEFFALWSEDVRADFYAAALTRTPSSVVAILVKYGLLRHREHVDLWRKAGLTTDFVLTGEAVVGVPGCGTLSGIMVVLGKVASTLVRGLEAAFGVCLIFGGIAVIYLSWPERMTSLKTRRPKNRT